MAMERLERLEDLQMVPMEAVEPLVKEPLAALEEAVVMGAMACLARAVDQQEVVTAFLA